MQPTDPTQTTMKAPVWAARMLQCVFALAALLLGALLVPDWRCQAARPFIGMFGLGWVLFGVFSFSFSWALPRRDGRGYYSPTSGRAVWLVFCFGTAAIGAVCLLAFAGYVPFKVTECG